MKISAVTRAAERRSVLIIQATTRTDQARFAYQAMPRRCATAQSIQATFTTPAARSRCSNAATRGVGALGRSPRGRHDRAPPGVRHVGEHPDRPPRPGPGLGIVQDGGQLGRPFPGTAPPGMSGGSRRQARPHQVLPGTLQPALAPHPGSLVPAHQHGRPPVAGERRPELAPSGRSGRPHRSACSTSWAAAPPAAGPPTPRRPGPGGPAGPAAGTRCRWAAGPSHQVVAVPGRGGVGQDRAEHPLQRAGHPHVLALHM